MLVSTAWTATIDTAAAVGNAVAHPVVTGQAILSAVASPDFAYNMAEGTAQDVVYGNGLVAPIGMTKGHIDLAMATTPAEAQAASDDIVSYMGHATNLALSLVGGKAAQTAGRGTGTVVREGLDVASDGLSAAKKSAEKLVPKPQPAGPNMDPKYYAQMARKDVPSVPGQKGGSGGGGKPTNAGGGSAADKVSGAAGALGAGEAGRGVSKGAGFTDEAKLFSHFEKHGAEFGAKSADDYLDLARQVMSEGDKVKYLYKGETRTGFVQFMGNTRKGKAKFAFVGTNSAGEITTLHTKRGKDLWKTLNQDAADKTIRPVP